VAAESPPLKLLPEALNQLLAPIALYPDALIALILPASTVPPMWCLPHGGFGSKFVFLVLLALGHAVDVRLMQRVNLLGILRLLSQYPTRKGEVTFLFLPAIRRELMLAA
jgi:Protein of unknown function (DUF3300)